MKEESESDSTCDAETTKPFEIKKFEDEES